MKNRSAKDYARLAATGFCMGSADIVPGVSGGTVAFLFDIYEELIGSIKNLISPVVLKSLFGLKLKTFWKEANINFLLSVGVGIIAAVLSLSHLFERLVTDHPRLVWSFFFGLVLASTVDVGRRIRRWNGSLIALFIVGAVFAFVLTGMAPQQTPEAGWFIFLCGAIVICAMILPGISGSFLLVLLGKYQFILSAVNGRRIVPIALFCLGAGFGILAFAQVLGRLFKHHHDATVACLAGLMLGSLRKIWPWNADIVSAGGDASPLALIGLIAFGIAVVFLLEKIQAIKQSDIA